MRWAYGSDPQTLLQFFSIVDYLHGSASICYVSGYSPVFPQRYYKLARQPWVLDKNEPMILIYVNHVHGLEYVRCNSRLILELCGKIVLWPRCKSIAPWSCSNIGFLL